MHTLPLGIALHIEICNDNVIAIALADKMLYIKNYEKIKLLKTKCLFRNKMNDIKMREYIIDKIDEKFLTLPNYFLVNIIFLQCNHDYQQSFLYSLKNKEREIIDSVPKK